MRTKTIQLFFLAVAAIAFVTSCNHTSGSFQTDSKTGVVYRFIKHNDGAMPTDSDFARVVLSYTEKGKDSVLFDSRKRGDSTGAIPLALKKSFNGCLEQGILMMSAGDSAQFEINADSLYLKYFHAPSVDKLPPGVHGKTYIFNVKLVSIMSKKDMKDMQDKQRQQYMEKMMARKAMEAPAIAKYLADNHYENVKPTEDSIFFLERGKAKGKQIKEGDSVEVKYVGTLLDGQVFDRSDKGPGTGTYKMLYSSKMGVIQGWIKVLETLHEGEKVKVLIPSAMAYGPRGQGQIIPFSPLIFEITVVNVKSNKA